MVQSKIKSFDKERGIGTFTNSLFKYVYACDIYITPYLNEFLDTPEQINELRFKAGEYGGKIT